MIRRSLIFALLVGSMMALAGPARAQFYPGGGYGWGDVNGAAALVGSNYTQAAAMQAKAQSRQFGQQAAMAQNSVVQSGIRNTLSSEAQSRTNFDIQQQQNTQDWWFQQQAQQAAQRRAVSYAGGSNEYPMTYGAAAAGRAEFGPASGPPKAAMDIIQWPIALQSETFASERAQIEAPYRRTPPKLSDPTPNDYRKMASIVEDMQAMLDWKLQQGMQTKDYNDAVAFLGKMAQEAAARSAAGL